MNTGQTLMTVGAMLLLSILILRVNNTFLTTSTAFMDTKFDILATSIATSEMEEISKLAFDQYTASNPATSLSQLTAPGNLGPESGETPATFNDIDDYDGYTKIDSTMPSAIFKIRCSVNYVAPTTPNIISTSPTWNKKITIYVTSISMMDTLKLSTIYSYWYFR